MRRQRSAGARRRASTPRARATYGTMAIGAALTTITESNHRVQQAQRLHQMSDAELAELGLKREEIAHHVFRDLFYI